MAFRAETFVFEGGLDLETSYLQLPKGRLIDCLNYECPPRGGYRRIDGYSLHDGSASPAAVPGEGEIRGVWIYQEELYAFRDQATEGGMFRATATGWQAVDLGTALDFENGSALFEETAQITGGTSGATAFIGRINVAGGLTDSSSQYGTLVIHTTSGLFQTGEDILVDGLKVAEAVGVQYANSLPKGGRYVFDNENFYGQEGQERMYGANGVGRAFEFDGTYFVPIDNGVDIDFPIQVIGHKSHLFLGYRNGSIISSSIGSPTTFSPLTGAAEIPVGDEITDFFQLPGGVLGIGCRQSFQFIYGNDATSWSVQQFMDHGIRNFTLQEIGGNIMGLDDRGIQAVSPAKEFGDFGSGTISEGITRDLLRINAQINVTASAINKTKSQYRIFFGQIGYFFTFTVNSLAGITKVLFNDRVLVTCSGEEPSGLEVNYFGSDDGKVFKFDSTNFFDGEPIESYVRLPFIFESAPTQRKAYRKAVIELFAEGDATELLGFADFDSGQLAASKTVGANTPQISGALWDSAVWDQFNWADQIYRGAVEFDVTGHGQNMSLLIYNEGTANAAFTLYGATVHFSPRRLNR